jgi:hypothetical protein
MKSFLLAFACTVSFMHAALSQNVCHSQQYQDATYRDASVRSRILQADAFTQNVLNREVIAGAPGSGGAGISIIRIPVVIHIVYNSPDQNISDEQARSQVEILNREFRKLHADTGLIPQAFRSLAADTRIEFVFASVNPQGYATNGLIRKKTNASGFGTDDKIKFSAQGGDDAWDSDRYLNIWVGRTQTGIVGYASAPGGPKDRDGVVISYTAFGNCGRASVPYNKGRTAVHEVGHWLGLRHIWGDQYCGNDGIEDTPPQSGATRGCPSGIVNSCGNNAAMYNNYMDLTNDACTNMFTNGQAEKMRALFIPGGARFALLNSNAATAIPLPDPIPEPVAEQKPVRLYPNPASDQVMINIGTEESLIGQHIILHNYLGQQLSRVRITGTISIMNLRAFKDGIYYVKVGDKGHSFKVVKGSGSVNPG